LQAPGLIEEEILEQIPTLMNLYEEKGYFIHIFKKIKSANLLFDIPNPSARGKYDTLLISIIITEGDINVKLYQELLNGFANELRKIEEGYKAFYHGSTRVEYSQDKFNAVQSLFYTFFESFPEESVIEGRRDAKIFVFGLSQAGKTTIIQSLQRNIASKTVPTTNVNISRILVNNLSIITYDAPGQTKLMDLWESYLKKKHDGLVFVLDLVHRTKYNDAKGVLHKIALLDNLKDLPLLILLNKVDLVDKPNVEQTRKALGVSELGTRPIKLFLTSGADSKGVNEAFNWLGQELSNLIELPDRVLPTSKVDEGIIFSRWDEDMGLEVIGVCPHFAFDDPEVIAIRCFSISQFVFGGEKFKRISFILPFTHLKSIAAIYFDFVADEAVRGGKLPLSLVVFYKEGTPNEKINYFNDYIFERLEEIKTFYNDKLKVQLEIEEIHKKIKEGVIAPESKVELTKETGKPAVTFPQKIADKDIEIYTDFKKLVKKLKTEQFFVKREGLVLKKSSSEALVCELCQNDLKLHANVYQSEFIVSFICDDCFLSFDKDDIDFMLNLFNIYGGFYGKNKRENISVARVIEQLGREIRSNKTLMNIDVLELQMLHKALLQGISVEKFEQELKEFLE